MYNLNPQDEFKEIQKSQIFRKLVKVWRARGFTAAMSKAAAKAMIVKPKDTKKVSFAEDQTALL